MAESVGQFFTELPSKIDASKTAGMSSIYQFDISGDNGGQWYVNLNDGKVDVVNGTAEAPSITLSTTDENWLKIVSGQLSGQTAFLTGKLKIKGDMSLAMKLQSIFKI
mgnify:CR=1 FL=1